MDKTTACVESYRRLKNLKLVGAELGIPWQTVYVHLRKADEPVTSDKLRYGSDTDRLAARSEQHFAGLVPDAEDMNLTKFQAKHDALVHGHRIDIKAARFLRGGWMFSLKKQVRTADFFVAFAYDVTGESVLHTFLFPGDCIRHYSTIRVKEGNRWWSFKISEHELSEFMNQLSHITPPRPRSPQRKSSHWRCLRDGSPRTIQGQTPSSVIQAGTHRAFSVLPAMP